MQAKCFYEVVIGDSRTMPELADESIDLVVTSPPYWNLKDYGSDEQIGFGQTLHEYLKSLYCVWKECFRVLKPGARLCVNVGDVFLRASTFGVHKVVPLHAEVTVQAEKIGFDYLGAIVWQKFTNKNPTGGSSFMGSYPYPPNGTVEQNFEFVLIFKKPGSKTASSKEVKEASVLTKEEWKTYFSGCWQISGEKQLLHPAAFPLEVPFRLIKMFSFVGDVVLDPFLGSGTTMQAALYLKRSAVGYEVNENFLPLIQQRLGVSGLNLFEVTLKVVKRSQKRICRADDYVDYQPYVKDL